MKPYLAALPLLANLPASVYATVSLLIGGVALGLIFRAIRPFGQLVIRRRDVIIGVGYGIFGLSMLGLSGWVWSQVSQ